MQTLMATQARPLILPFASHHDPTQVGKYNITYSIATDWPSLPRVSALRHIIVSDLDECSLRPTHPKYPVWHARCHKHARCVNTVGSYRCECKAGLTGDGVDHDAKSLRRPENEGQGPPGCVDTEPPTVSVFQDLVRAFRVCKCGDISKLPGDSETAGPDPHDAHRKYAEQLEVSYGSSNVLVGGEVAV